MLLLVIPFYGNLIVSLWFVLFYMYFIIEIVCILKALVGTRIAN